MIKLLASSVCVLILSFQSLNPGAVLANSQPFDDCMRRLNNKIQEDLEFSFPLLKELKKNDSAYIYKFNDLAKLNILNGKEDTHLNSLVALFRGTSIGDRQLLIISDKYIEKWDNTFTGYLFYKEVDGTNILLKIKRGDKEWKVVKQSKLRGKYITFEQIDKDCVR